MKTRLTLLALLLVAGTAQAQQKDMSFFITSQGGSADLGGLAGADKRCQSLAAAAGSKKVWRAYLSTTGAKAVNARDRIGKGPWQNAKGVVVAKDLANLHANPNINRATGLDEKGNIVNARVDKPNMHDILTGSRSDGRAHSAGGEDSTCSNWTSADKGSAVVGHHDREGLRDDAESKSWNTSHFSRGCSHDALKGSGGDGRFYCFAVK
jgi:hypothetical protein